MEKSTLIIITGPESSGKSSLMQEICSRTEALGIEEKARAYLNKKSGPYDAGDLMNIATEQTQEILRAKKQGISLIVSDTGPEVVEIWYREKFGSPPDSLCQMSKSLPSPHYLLCKPDLPWEYDPLRENPHDRERLFSIYQEWLEKNQCNYTIISGVERLEKSLIILENIASGMNNT